MKARAFAQIMGMIGRPGSGSLGGRANFGNVQSSSGFYQQPDFSNVEGAAYSTAPRPAPTGWMQEAYRNVGETAGMDSASLLGAAREWGIENPESMSLDSLRGAVQAHREQAAGVAADPSRIDTDLRELGSIGIGAGKGLVGSLETLAGIVGTGAGALLPGQDPESMGRSARKLARELYHLEDASAWFSKLQEGVRRNAHPEMRDRLDVAAGLGSFAGMAPLGYAAWRAAGIAGQMMFGANKFVQGTSVLAKAGRAAVQGGASTAAFDVGSDKPWLPDSGDLTQGPGESEWDVAARAIFGTRTGSAAFGAAIAGAIGAIASKVQESPATRVEHSRAVTRRPQAGGPDDLPDYEFINDPYATPPTPRAITPSQRLLPAGPPEIDPGTGLPVFTRGAAVEPWQPAPPPAQALTSAAEALGTTPKRVAQVTDWVAPPVESFLFPVNPGQYGGIGSMANPMTAVDAARNGPQLPSTQPLFELTQRLREAENALQDNQEAMQLGWLRDDLENYMQDPAQFQTEIAALQKNIAEYEAIPGVKDTEAAVELLRREYNEYLGTLRDAYGLEPESTMTEIAAARTERVRTPATELADALGTVLTNMDGTPLTLFHGTGVAYDRPQQPLLVQSTKNLWGDGQYYTTHPAVSSGEPDVVAMSSPSGGDPTELFSKTKFRSDGDQPYAVTRYRQQVTAQKMAEQNLSDAQDRLRDLPIVYKDKVAPELYAKMELEAQADLEAAENKLSDLAKTQAGIITRVDHVIAKKLFNIGGEIDPAEAINILNVANQAYPEYSDHWNDMLNEFESYKPGDITLKPTGEYLHESMQMARKNTDKSSWGNFGLNFTNDILRQAGYDVLEYPGGMATSANIKHRAFVVLDVRAIVPKFGNVDEIKLAYEAAKDRGIKLTKQLNVMDSPALDDIAQVAEITEADVAKSSLARRAGSTVVVKGISDPGSMVKAIVEGRLEYSGVKPTSWKLVEREGRVDLVLSSGEPLSDEAAQMYKEYGVVPGMMVKTMTKGGASQRMVTGAFKNKAGNTMISVSDPGAKGYGAGRTKDFVRRSYGVSPKNILVDDYTFPGIDAEPLWQDFMKRLERAGRGAVGQYSNHPVETLMRWEIAEEFNHFIIGHQISDPVKVIGVQSYFDAKLVEAYRSIVPAELNAIDEAVAAQNEAIDQIIEGTDKTLDVDVLESMAGARGFQVAPFGDGTYALIDRFSPEKLYMDSFESARAFLQEYTREPVDIDPGGEVPIEIMRNFTPDATPETEPGTEQQYAHMRADLDHMAADEAGQAVEDRTGIPVSRDFIPQPPMAPPGSGGPPDPNSPFKQMNEHIGDLNRRHTGFMHRNFWPIRTTFADLESDLMAIGVPGVRPWLTYDKLANGMDVAHNEAHPFFTRKQVEVDNIGSKHLRSGDVWHVFAEHVETKRIELGKKLGMSDGEIGSVTELRKIFRELHGNEYAEHLTELVRFVNTTGANQRMDAVSPYGNTDDYQYIKPFVEASKDMFADFRFPNASKILDQYIKSYTFNKYAGEAWAEGQATWRAIDNWKDNDGSRPLAPIAKFVLDWMQTVRRGNDGERDLVLDATQSLYNTVLGPVVGPVTKGEASDLIGGMLNAVHRGVMGFRLAPVIRDSSQPILAIPRVGLANLGKAYKTMFRGTDEEKDFVVKLMSDYGVLQKGIPPTDAGLVITGEYVDNASKQFTAQERARRELRAKVAGFTRDMLPKWLRTVNGTKLDPMWLYTKQGSMNRVLTGYAAYLNFTDAAAVFKNKRAAALAGGHFDQMSAAAEELMQVTHSDAFSPAIARRIREQIDLGDLEGATRTYANQTVNSTQFRTGVREVAPGMRGHGARAAWQFGSFSVQSIAYLREVAKASQMGGSGKRYAAKTLVTLSAALGAFALAKKKTGINFTKFFWFNPSYTGGPAVQVAQEGLKAAGAVSDMSGGYDPRNDERRSFENLLTPAPYIGAAAMMNPAGGLLEGYNQIMGPEGIRASPNPGTAALRYFISGDKRGSGTDFERYFNQTPSTDDLLSPMQGGLGGGAGAQ